MYINESLANGLKERLWNELDDLDIKAKKVLSQYLKTHKVKLGSRSGIQKLDHAFQAGLGHSILAAGKSGSRTSPILLYAMLERDSQSVRNDWQEKMFCIRQVSIGTMADWNEYPVNVRIGEHAVSLVFQRHPDIFNADTKNFDIFKILPEFKSLAFFGPSMLWLFDSVSKNCNHSLDNISIPFVSPSGLFLGDYNKQLNMCDVRTFIADHQLTPDQAALVERVRKLLDDNYYYFDMLPFALLHFTHGVHIEFAVFWAKFNAVAIEFAELATWKEENLAFKREFHQLMINHISGFDPLNSILTDQENAREAKENSRQAREDTKLKKE
jgi:hypothetical protein